MKQYRIEIAIGDKGRLYDIRPLGNEKYEILDEGETLGTIKLDQKDHTHCQSRGCELDLEVLQAIREGTQFHERWHKGHGHL